MPSRISFQHKYLYNRRVVVQFFLAAKSGIVIVSSLETSENQTVVARFYRRKTSQWISFRTGDPGHTKVSAIHSPLEGKHEPPGYTPFVNTLTRRSG